MSRLEELKMLIEDYPIGGNEYGQGIGIGDVDWLIDQVEELEEDAKRVEKNYITLYDYKASLERVIEKLEKENARLNKLRNFVDMGMESIEAYTEQIKDENKSLEEALLSCRVTLQFYANDESYIYQEREIKWGESITHFKQSEIEKDRGERARKLLNPEEML